MAALRISLLLGTALLALVSAVAQPAGKKGGQAPASNPRVTIEPRQKPGAEQPVDRRGANIRVDSTLVLIPTTVTDPLNRFVTSLDKDFFKLYEDNVEHPHSRIA